MSRKTKEHLLALLMAAALYAPFWILFSLPDSIVYLHKSVDKTIYNPCWNWITLIVTSLYNGFTYMCLYFTVVIFDWNIWVMSKFTRRGN